MEFLRFVPATGCIVEAVIKKKWNTKTTVKLSQEKISITKNIIGNNLNFKFRLQVDSLLI